MSLEKRLFIIDDEVLLLDALRDYLEKCGLKVFAYESMPDLESELKEKKPHAILLDILLPDISGIEILKQIKKIDRRIPVVMMTGYADDSARLESLSSGAYALLTKPFKRLEELYHIMNNCIEHFIEILKTEQLTLEVEERYRVEKMNVLELDFLKNLQHMIGEAEDPVFVLKNAHSLLKDFLDFDYFGTLLIDEKQIDIHIFPVIEDNTGLTHSIASVLLQKIPGRQKNPGERIVTHGITVETDYTAKSDIDAIIAELSTANRNYGYAALCRERPFGTPELSIFTRFCSHITLTLEKVLLFNEIKVLSIHDGLTGVYNHAYIIGEIETEIERSRRYNTSFSIVLFDIDDFKMTNDEYGHLAGDHVLKYITQVMKENFRTIDVIGRYGGEEFLVILPETDLEKAIIASERLRNALEKGELEFEGNRISVTISGGIATYVPGFDAKRIIKLADDNLYHAKKNGKNGIYYENP